MNSIVKAAIFTVFLIVLCGVGAYLIIFREPSGPTPAAPGEPSVAAGPKAEAPPPPSSAEDTKLKTPVRQPQDDEVAFTVRVVERSSGKPLAQASVLVQRVTEGDRPGEKVYDSGRRPGPRPGEFEVSLPPGMYQVRGQAPSHSSVTERVTVMKDRPPLVVTLELDRGISISGRVLTREGKGIPGARVRAYPAIGNPNDTFLQRILQIPAITEDAQKPPQEAISGDDGSYLIEGLEQRYYTVKAAAAGYAPGERPDIPAPKDGVDLRLPRGGELGGVVVESGGGGPVEGAKVSAYAHVDSSDILAIIETRSRPPFDTVTTGADGSFKFTTLGTGTYNFKVLAPGFQEGRFLKIRVREGDNAGQRFAISRGLTIAGTVLSPSGEPLAGAKVRATRNAEAGRQDQQNMFVSFDDTSIPTDPQGQFVFDTLEPGKYTLLASHRDYASEQRRDVEAGATDLTITLPVGGAVAGTITDAATKAPVVGARVTVGDLQDLRKEGITDEKGRYYVGALHTTGGKRYLNVHADGYARLSNVALHVEDGKINEPQDFELQPTAIVSGRVVNQKGDGVPGARVMAKRQSGPSAPVQLTVGSGVTSSDGRFTIKDLEAGEETELEVMASGYLIANSATFSIQPGQSTEVGDIVLALGGMVEGVVMGSDGSPLEGVQVLARKEGETAADPALVATSDARGKFFLRGLPAGTLDLVAKSQHHLEEEVQGVKVAEGLITKDVRIVLRTGGQVRGRVVDSDGNPVSEAQITAQDVSEGGLKELRAESDHQGLFVVEGVQSQDTIELTVQHSEYGSWSEGKIQVGEDELRVVLPRMGSVKGVVVDVQGNPLPSFSVQPQAKDSSAGKPSRKPLSPRTFQANQDGSFTYTGIAPGTYDIHVRAPSYSAFTFPDVEVNGQIVDLGRAVLREGGVISGSVTDTSGKAISGATVRVVGGLQKFNTHSPGRAAGDPSLVVTDNRGYFEIRNLKGGSLALQVTAPGYMGARLDDVNPDQADRSRDLAIVLEPGSEIFGTVFDVNGNARNGVSVYLVGMGNLANQPDSSQRTATNSEGRFQFMGLASGTYRVTAQRVGAGKNSTQEIRVGPGDRQELELYFE